MHAVDNASRSADASVNPLSATAAAPIQVCLFGGLALLKRGKPVSLRGGARSDALLLSLALDARRGGSRERLLSQVLPASAAALAFPSLHTLVHSLHPLLTSPVIPS